jgi:hypothetical protein
MICNIVYIYFIIPCPDCFLANYIDILDWTSCPMKISDLLNPIDEEASTPPNIGRSGPLPGGSGQGSSSTGGSSSSKGGPLLTESTIDSVVQKLRQQISIVSTGNVRRYTSIYDPSFGDSTINNSDHLAIRSKLLQYRLDYVERTHVYTDAQPRICKKNVNNSKGVYASEVLISDILK